METKFEHFLEKKGLWYNIRKKRKRGEKPNKLGDEGYPDKKQWKKLTENSTNYMFFQNLKTIKEQVEYLLNLNEKTIDEILSNHDWASDHISTSKDDIEEVFNFLKNKS